MVRMALEENEGWVCLKLDVENAHNSIHRAAVLEVLEDQPNLRHMAWSFATSMAPPTTLETGGRVWGESGDGLSQGKPSSGGYYSTGWHPEVRELDMDVGAGGGAARFFSDDGYLFGPPEVVFPAFLRFEKAILQRCGLRLQRLKTAVYAQGELPPTAAQLGLKRAGEEIDGVFYPGFECVGVAVGSPGYVKNWLNNKVEEIHQVVKETVTVLEEDLQALWTILLSSTQQKFGYWLSLQYPDDVMPAAVKLDTILWEMYQQAAGLHIPREDEGLGVEGILNVPIH
jgi:hypothetical protein